MPKHTKSKKKYGNDAYGGNGRSKSLKTKYTLY
jgi:hypothetical protein